MWKRHSHSSAGCGLHLGEISSAPLRQSSLYEVTSSLGPWALWANSNQSRAVIILADGESSETCREESWSAAAQSPQPFVWCGDDSPTTPCLLQPVSPFLSLSSGLHASFKKGIIYIPRWCDLLIGWLLWPRLKRVRERKNNGVMKSIFP